MPRTTRHTTTAAHATTAPTATAETPAPPSETPAPATTPRADLCEIAVADIGSDGTNPRTLFALDGEAGITNLAASIEARGLLQPITVRPNADGTPPYLLVAGERRLRAVRDVLKRATITALVRRDIDGAAAAVATVLENLQRRDLHAMEEARGLAQLRARHGYSPKKIAAAIGRRETWIKDRLKLCDLPAAVQDRYLRSTSGHLTLAVMRDLHDFTHGGPENQGFPELIAVLVEDIDAGRIDGVQLSSSAAARHPSLVRTIQHTFYPMGDGRWGGNYFDTKTICRRCPFGAYRPGFYDGQGYCLVPSHYAALQRKGQETWEQARATQDAARPSDPASVPPQSGQTVGGQGTPMTAAQKGRETKERHKRQRDAYYPTVQAITRAMDLLVNVDGSHDIAVTCAYTLSPSHVSHEAVQQVIKRHGLAGFPGLEATPSRAQIERLRHIPPADLLRYTLEALLLTQAARARDYDPGKTGPDSVLALYIQAHGGSVVAPAEREDVEAAMADAEDEEDDRSEDRDVEEEIA